MHDLFLVLDISENSLLSKKCESVFCLHIAILRQNFKLCQTLLIEELQRDKTCTFSKENNEQYCFPLPKSGYIYQKYDKEHMGVHFTSPEISYENCKTLSHDSVFSFESSDDLKWTAFHFAALTGDCKILRLLVDKNVPGLHKKNRKNQTCLHIATLYGNEDISKSLINCYNLNLDDVDENKWTPIHCAAYSGNEILFKYLLDKGSDPFEETNNGDNCLHIASYYGHFEICEIILLRHQFYRPLSKFLNFVNHDGNTYLHTASMTAQVNICKLLLAYNIDTTRKNNSGKTAHDILARNNLENILVIFNQNPGTAGERFYSSFRY